MKERNEVKKSALNYIIAQIKNKRIELQKELEDVDVIKILKKEIKAICETI
ncbi:GatB/YqeY domain-containing protein [bacterium]|nr:GatB/YqeY domain-containing protein [bacterium]